MAVSTDRWVCYSDDPTPNYQDVRITKAENGFIVRVGCRAFVALKWCDVGIGLGKYWDDSIAAENKHCNK